MHDLLPTSTLAMRAKTSDDHATREFYHHSSGQRVYTDAVLTEALAKQYPGLAITVIPENRGADLLAWAAAGFAAVKPVDESPTCPLSLRFYIPPPRRMDGDAGGVMASSVLFGKYVFEYKGKEYILYISNGRDGTSSFPTLITQYLIGAESHVADEVIRGATMYAQELHEQIWVFDQGYWQKSSDLYRSMIKASWDDVILDEGMKRDIRNDVMRFFASRERYDRLKVPWKRGIIYYGPPGNGKTISIKAMMHSLNDLPSPVPTLYVRSLKSFLGPEFSIAEIFSLARQQAPCLLVFEDLDSLVRDDSRTYFLNEVDGLQVNEGVLMIGSTNYLDRLDPGISKRPSRFDRKYLFPKPSLAERVQYCEYWRGKLSSNHDITFPHELSTAIAKITDDFSFAFLQEAFVASLLAIANRDDGKGDGKGEEGECNGEDIGTDAPDAKDIAWSAWLPRREALSEEVERLRGVLAAAGKSEYSVDYTVNQMAANERTRRQWGFQGHTAAELDAMEEADLDKLVLWREMKRQVKILREEM